MTISSNISVHEKLRAVLVTTLAADVDGEALITRCSAFGLPEGDFFGAFKPTDYVAALLPTETAALQSLASRVLSVTPKFGLEEALWASEEDGRRRTTELTRRALLDELLLLKEPVHGRRLELIDFLKRVWPLDSMPSTDSRFETAAGDIWQHCINNFDYDDTYLYGSYLELLTCSDKRLGKFLGALVHPTVRQGEEQAHLVGMINRILEPDGLALQESSRISGHPVYAFLPTERGVSGTPKNLIFATTAKPRLVLVDAINNDFRIENENACLIYDRPFGPSGLQWSELVAWWAERTGEHSAMANQTLRSRLRQSLDSAPERILFDAYFSATKALGPVPALIPQVWLHFDPLSARDRGAAPALLRQRMDFLLLFSPTVRVVLEVDGKQHYAEGETASPRKYAEMVSLDRGLRLQGYEMYRFGGYELSDQNGAQVMHSFFAELFKKHGL